MSAAPTVSVEPIFVTSGGNTVVNQATAGKQKPASAASLANGGYVVAWVTNPTNGGSSTERVVAQLFNADGTVAGSEFSVAPGQNFWQASPTVARLDGGGFVIGWSMLNQGVSHSLLAQRYDAAGQQVGGAITLATLDAGSFGPGKVDLTALQGGGFLATWGTATGATGTEIMAQRYDANGSALGSAFQVNTYATQDQYPPDAAVLADGSFVVVWQSSGQDGAGTGAYGQRFSAAGAPLGSEFRVNTVTTGNQSSPHVTALAGGGFVVTWDQPDMFNPAQAKAQVYNAAGVAVGGEIIVDSFNSPGAGPGSIVTGLPDGGFFVAWHKDFDNVRGQRYDANGTPLGTSFAISTGASGQMSYRAAEALIVTESGQLITFFHQGQNPTPNDTEIYAQRYQVKNTAVEQVPLVVQKIVVGDDGIGSNVVTVTLSVDYGTITVDLGGSGVGATGNGTASVALTGTVDQLNALLIGGAGGSVSYLADTDTPPASATLTVEVRDVENQTATATIALAITGVGELAVAQPDALATMEPAVATGNLFADNGSGADIDPDGPALSISAVNGSAANVGTQITLASGALLTVQADGSYQYDPNHVFDALPVAGSGASNLTGQDSFTYTLAGGNTATVTVTVSGLDSNDTLLGTGNNDTLNGGLGNDTLDGGAGDDTLIGADGNDVLDGGPGDDTMTGGLGDDTYYFDSDGDVFNELPGEGNDTIVVAQLFGDIAEGSPIENLVTIDPAGTTPIQLRGNSAANTLTGNAGENVLTGGGGSDVLIGGAGDDVYFVDSGDPAPPGDDVVVEGVGGGNDVVYATGSYTLTVGAEIERLEAFTSTGTTPIRLTGNEFGQSISGNAGDNELNGGGGHDALFAAGGNDVLDGGAGDDHLEGGSGNDTYIVDDAADFVLEYAGEGYDDVLASVSFALPGIAEVELLRASTTAPAAAIDLNGNSYSQTIRGNDAANVLKGFGGNDTLEGGGGDDTLDGGVGSDAMAGGAGDDAYVVDNAGDTIAEGSGGGFDRVLTSVSYTLSDEVERLAVNDAATTYAIDLTGNAQANVIAGNDGANVIDGRDGADTMTGLGGNDTIKGGGGDDMLDGGVGADAMTGGSGDDTYVVDSAGDTVVEGFGGGLDTVLTSISHMLSDDVERLAVNGAGTTHAIDLTGNAQANVIWGNDGANVIDGRTGADAMTGFGGNDFYIVDDAGDTIVEGFGGGLDTVFTSVAYTLSDDIERVGVNGFTTTYAINLTGNVRANEMWGNDGANILDGRNGADIMSGFGGNDFYIVDDAGDVIVEGSGGGLDTVFTSVAYTLSDDIERVGVNGFSTTYAINLTGNVRANEMWGNDGANVLDGRNGADIMTGFGGNDFYIVDNAGDTIVEGSGGGYDTVFTSIGYTLSDDIERLGVNGSTSTYAIDLTGNARANEISGNNGANVIAGQGGSDVLIGYGGADTFAFTSSIYAGSIDVILDFQVGVDKIGLDDGEFAGFSFGMLASGAFDIGTAAHDADDRIIYDQASGALYFDADGSGAGAAVQFAALSNGLLLTASDFQVI